MRPGDVLFESGSGVISEGIKIVDGFAHLGWRADISHCAVVVVRNLLLEADDSTQLTSLDSKGRAISIDPNGAELKTNRNFIGGFRYIGRIQQDVILDKLTSAAHYVLGQSYSYKRIIKGFVIRAIFYPFNLKLEEDEFGGTFCSALVQSTLQDIGLIPRQVGDPLLSPVLLRQFLETRRDDWAYFEINYEYFDDPMRLGQTSKKAIENSVHFEVDSLLMLATPLLTLINNRLTALEPGWKCAVPEQLRA